MKNERQSRLPLTAKDKPSSEEEIAEAFEREIARQEDLLYGMALFFEGISLLFAGQDAVIETYRKQFRNIIRSGKRVADWARRLLLEARAHPGRAFMLENFRFLPGEGHSDPQELARRAAVLVETYNELFPGRPRDQALTRDETLRLVEAASRKLPAQQP